MKKFKDMKVGDFIFIGSNGYKVKVIEHKNGYMVINDIYIPNNHINASMVKIGNKMVLSDFKKWSKYILLETKKHIAITASKVFED